MHFLDTSQQQESIRIRKKKKENSSPFTHHPDNNIFLSYALVASWVGGVSCAFFSLTMPLSQLLKRSLRSLSFPQQLFRMRRRRRTSTTHATPFLFNFFLDANPCTYTYLCYVLA